MGVKSIIYILAIVTTVFGSVAINPVIGLWGYLLSYNINPMSFWWGAEVPEMFQRYSLIFSVAIMGGAIFHFSRLRFVKWLEIQETLLLLFICTVWFSTVVGVPSHMLGHYASKMTKIAIILILASHLITDLKYFNWMVWIYIISAFFSGFEMFSGSSVSFNGGRLDVGVGGSDFSEGNFLAAHYLMILPWIGIKVLSGSWTVRLFCIATAALVVNILILVESRGAFLGIAAGLVLVLIYCGPRYRKAVLILLAAGVIGFVSLADTSFWDRMQSLKTEASEMDASASHRLDAWKAAVLMFQDYPLGVGQGNFTIMVGNYNPEIEGRDTHNTFFRCLAELGFQGLAILLLMIQNAFRILSGIKQQLNMDDPIDKAFDLHILALRTGIAMYLVATMFLSHTYIEEFYWLLMFPLFLKRSFENHRYDQALGR